MKLHILVVDDSPNIRKVIIRYLDASDLGGISLTFSEASEGEDAETILQSSLLSGKPVDILFLDWIMPKVTGLDLLKKIRSIEMFEENPQVVMLTAETSVDQIDACLKYNVSSYLTKPFTQETLETALKRAIKKMKTNEVGRAV